MSCDLMEAIKQEQQPRVRQSVRFSLERQCSMALVPTPPSFDSGEADLFPELEEDLVAEDEPESLAEFMLSQDTHWVREKSASPVPKSSPVAKSSRVEFPSVRQFYKGVTLWKVCFPSSLLGLSLSLSLTNMWNYHFPAFAYVQVLPNTKCPAGKDHYSPGFAQTVAHPTYQERVRTAVECGTSNCGVPLHLNDFVVLDVDCVFVDDHGVKQVDTMLLECVKRALPARNHTYCVVSNPLPGLVDFLSAAACLISLFCMSVCASGSDQTWWISFLLPQHRSQGHGQDYQGLPRSVEIVWRRFDVWQIAHRRCLLQGGRHGAQLIGQWRGPTCTGLVTRSGRRQRKRRNSRASNASSTYCGGRRTPPTRGLASPESQRITTTMTM